MKSPVPIAGGSTLWQQLRRGFRPSCSASSHSARHQCRFRKHGKCSLTTGAIFLHLSYLLGLCVEFVHLYGCVHFCSPLPNTCCVKSAWLNGHGETCSFERLQQQVLRSYVDSNPHIKWCPRPGCGCSISLADQLSKKNISAASVEAGSLTVTCACGHAFCWNCLEEAHEPASCEQVCPRDDSTVNACFDLVSGKPPHEVPYSCICISMTVAVTIAVSLDAISFTASCGVQGNRSADICTFASSF